MTSPNAIAQDSPCEFKLDGFSWSMSDLDDETGYSTVLCWNESTNGIRFRYILPEGVKTKTQILKLNEFKNSK